jgi:2,3-bisphosphoglycerate-independent phosphoglycerate mutase
MNFLFLFLDGVGLGGDDPEINPFASASMPRLQKLLGNHKLLASLLESGNGHKSVETSRATLVGLDACLGVNGFPQSATGQATLLTGINIPKAIGYHYGPKPNRAIVDYVTNGNLFNGIKRLGQRAALLGAYPPGYFAAIQSGRRKYSTVPLAAVSAGLALKTRHDLISGDALAADFTAQGWREHLGMTDVPVYSPYQAGKSLARLASQYEFAFFEYWMSDYVGHHQDLAVAQDMLASLDDVLGGLLDLWDDQTGLILITSDHGNLEDLSTRRHTRNPVPAVLIGAPHLRKNFSKSLSNLTDIAPAILAFLSPDNNM